MEILDLYSRENGMEKYEKSNCKDNQDHNRGYELKILYNRSCNLNSNGEEIGKVEYSIEKYDIDMNLSTIGLFESFEEMKDYLNEKNLFDCLDNDPIIGVFKRDGLEVGDEIELVKFSKVLFNGKLIIRQNQ